MRHQKGICPRCKRKRPLTHHHVYPKRIFGLSDITVLICRDCHNELEEALKVMETSILQAYSHAYVVISNIFTKGVA